MPRYKPLTGTIIIIHDGTRVVNQRFNSAKEVRKLLYAMKGKNVEIIIKTE